MPSIQELMSDVRKFDLVLPEFQREYIWTKEQAKQLLISLFRSFPTGSLLFWKTENPPAIKHDAVPRDKIGTVSVILDGQQRLTSLFLLIENAIPPYYLEGDIKSDPRNLYFNLGTGEFQYYQVQRMRGNPEWLPVVDCFKHGDGTNVFKIARTLSGDPEEQLQLANNLNENLQKLKSIKNKEYPIQYVPSDADIDDAITVFDRVNRQGTNLSDSELALAHMCGKWPEARRTLKNKINELGEQGFTFDLRFMIRCLVGVVKGRALFDTVHNTPKEELLAGWQKLSKVLDYLVTILPAHAHIHSTDDLNTTNVLVPLVVYLGHNEGKFQGDMEIRHFIHWLYAAHTWARYTSQTDQRLDHDVAIILRSSTPCGELVDAIIDQRGRIEVKPGDLEDRSIQHPLYRMTRILVKAKGALDWFNGSPLAKTVGKSYAIESHHIFPSSLLYEPDRYSPNNHLHVKVVNEIANRVFLTSDSNVSLSNQDPGSYLPQVKRRYPRALVKQLIPKDPELWKLDRYEDFLNERRRLIAAAINELMDGLLKETLTPAPLTLDDFIKAGESSALEFKATLRWDTRTRQANKELTKVVVKAIAGFLNTEGGILLIGVDDDGTVVGIEEDFKALKRQDIDGFQQVLIQAISDYLGTEFCKYLKVAFEKRDKKTTCIVRAQPSPKPVFVLDKGTKEFYIRAGNTTRPLDVEKAHEYIEMHWES